MFLSIRYLNVSQTPSPFVSSIKGGFWSQFAGFLPEKHNGVLSGLFLPESRGVRKRWTTSALGEICTNQEPWFVQMVNSKLPTWCHWTDLGRNGYNQLSKASLSWLQWPLPGSHCWRKKFHNRTAGSLVLSFFQPESSLSRQTDQHSGG